MIKVTDLNNFFVHQDGGLYFALDIATSTIDGTSEFVIYKHIMPFEPKTWARPAAEWTEQRFRKVESGPELALIMGKPRQEFQAEVTANKAARRAGVLDATKIQPVPVDYATLHTPPNSPHMS